MDGIAIRAATVRRTARELATALLDAVCPPHCPACGILADGPCARCRPALEWRRGGPRCRRCGEPKPAPDAPCPSGPGRGHHRWLRGIALARAPLRYAGSGGAVVRRLKFAHDRGAAGFLARAMAGELQDWARGPGRRALCVAVPVSRAKRRRRGFDQASLLAELVSARLGLEYRPGALIRVRDTLPQGDPRVTSRAANVAGAFVTRSRRPVEDRAIVLVDDVTTSGSTARECARVLRAAGARSIALLTAVVA